MQSVGDACMCVCVCVCVCLPGKSGLFKCWCFIAESSVLSGSKVRVEFCHVRHVSNAHERALENTAERKSAGRNLNAASSAEATRLIIHICQIFLM